jgi:hypothetical protein
MLEMWRQQRNPMAGRPRKPKVVYRGGIRCFAELNMTMKGHYCFGDCRLLKMGRRILEQVEIGTAEVRGRDFVGLGMD